MRFHDFAIKDPQFLMETRKTLNGSLFWFAVIFYGMSGIAIYTSSGRAFSESLAELLPSIIFTEYLALRKIDDTSHLSYLISIPSLLGVSFFFSIRQISITSAFDARLRTAKNAFQYSLLEPTILSFFSVVSILVLLFSGTLSQGGGERSSGWLLWPISGLVAYSSTGLIIVSVNSIWIAIFARAKKKELKNE